MNPLELVQEQDLHMFEQFPSDRCQESLAQAVSAHHHSRGDLVDMGAVEHLRLYFNSRIS